jgi:hypothetical protein
MDSKKEGVKLKERLILEMIDSILSLQLLPNIHIMNK